MDLHSYSESVFSESLQYLSTDEGWIDCGETDRVKIWNTKYKNTQFNLVKGRYLVSLSPKEIFQNIMEAKERMNWDKNCKNMETIEVIQNTLGHWIRVDYITYYPVSVVSSRDFVVIWVAKEFEDGTIVTGTKSIPDYHNAPRLEAGVVRGEILAGGFYIKPVLQPDGQIFSELTCLAGTDVKGWIPISIVNKAVLKTIMIVKNLGDYSKNKLSSSEKKEKELM